MASAPWDADNFFQGAQEIINIRSIMRTAPPISRAMAPGIALSVRYPV